MEVRPGYQQTDIGVIPRDWDVKSLGDCASFRTGPFGSALHKSDYIDGGVPVVNPMHINDGRIEPTRAMSITETAAKALADFRLKAGEVVIGRRGDMGRCAVVRPEQDGWLCGTGSMIVRGRGIDEHFLQRVLSSPRAIASIEEASVGSTMVNLNQGTLARLKIPFPPITEQAAIAAALSDIDALLAGLDRLITKNLDLKQAAMQQLLTGRTRLPGFRERWTSTTLGDLLSFKNGLNKAKAFFGHGTPIVNYMDVFRDTKLTTAKIAGRVSLTSAEIRTFDVRKGDVFFTRTRRRRPRLGWRQSCSTIQKTQFSVASCFEVGLLTIAFEMTSRPTAFNQLRCAGKLLPRPHIRREH
jgi:restriction endonuclease S subunit